MKKDYEFTALIEISLIITADNEKQARQQVEKYSAEGWVRNGEIVGLSDVEIINEGEHEDDKFKT